MSDLSFEQLCELFNYSPKRRPLEPKEAAEILSLSYETLEGYRTRGVPLRYFSPPGTRIVRYAERDVLAWLARGARYSTSEQAAV
ncbi:helix-turn-helix domain-containing protein [Sphingomonas sp.]|uniref:helix-turn-helix transcriptional regulator n=1 Tax=Sphingomonas sp. TaxID=28214 RepID=UPI0025D79751|nr:helix-turn-helix domain-containing protein [Sphingomonas sp.]